MHAARGFVRGVDQAERLGRGREDDLGLSGLGGRMQRRTLHTSMVSRVATRITIVVDEVMPAMAHPAEQERGEEHERAQGARQEADAERTGHGSDESMARGAPSPQ